MPTNRGYSHIFFSDRGGGRGSPRPRGGSIFYCESEKGGGGLQEGKGPGGRLRRIGDFGGGGGLNIFFRGRNVHQVPAKNNNSQRLSKGT